MHKYKSILVIIFVYFWELQFAFKCSILVSPKKRGVKKMTKKAMIDYIEQSGMVINFSRSYFNHLLKKQVEEFYQRAIKYNDKKK